MPASPTKGLDKTLSRTSSLGQSTRMAEATGTEGRAECGECTGCYNTFTSNPRDKCFPRMMSCSHTFCQNCILQMTGKSDRRSVEWVRCKKCKVVTTCPGSAGLETLPMNNAVLSPQWKRATGTPEDEQLEEGQDELLWNEGDDLDGFPSARSLGGTGSMGGSGVLSQGGPNSSRSLDGRGGLRVRTAASPVQGF